MYSQHTAWRPFLFFLLLHLFHALHMAEPGRLGTVVPKWQRVRAFEVVIERIGVPKSLLKLVNEADSQTKIRRRSIFEIVFVPKVFA